MTTIVYKDGVIAYDSRMTCSNGVVMDDSYQKAFFKGDISIVYCGEVGDSEEFMDSVFNDTNPSRYLDGEALVLYGNELYCVDVSEQLLRKIPLRLDHHYAIGSGTRFALAYMDCGMNAFDAVSMACKRDIYSGGKIRTLEIK